MTDLTSEQKAQVAELLGWSAVESRGTTYWTKGNNAYGNPLTLEALLAYCREREWFPVLTTWDGDYEWDIYKERTEGTDIFGRHPDPVTALSLAVLAAHEQEKAR